MSAQLRTDIGATSGSVRAEVELSDFFALKRRGKWW